MDSYNCKPGCRRKKGRYVGDSSKKLRDELTYQGYNPEKVIPLWTHRGHSGFAIVDFGKDWSGFKDAIMLEKAYERDLQGKKDWLTRRQKGDKLYAWVARAEDYHSNGKIGQSLKERGDLKLVSEKQAEDWRKDTALTRNLCNSIESKDEEWKINDELQEAGNELINGLQDSLAKRKFSDTEATEKIAEISTFWDEQLRDPSWHPFKIIKDDNAKLMCDDISWLLAGILGGRTGIFCIYLKGPRFGYKQYLGYGYTGSAYNAMDGYIHGYRSKKGEHNVGHPIEDIEDDDVMTCVENVFRTIQATTVKDYYSGDNRERLLQRRIYPSFFICYIAVNVQ